MWMLMKTGRSPFGQSGRGTCPELMCLKTLAMSLPAGGREQDNHAVGVNPILTRETSFQLRQQR